jgi:4-aminobutyrate aminotransferase
MRCGSSRRRCHENGECPCERASPVCDDGTLFALLTSWPAFNFSSKELFAYLHNLRDDPAVDKNILDIRGQGLMVAVEFASPEGFLHDPVVKASAPHSMASRVAKRCIEKGMLILTTSVYQVVRFIPPLNITQADLTKGYEIFKEAVVEIVKEG